MFWIIVAGIVGVIVVLFVISMIKDSIKEKRFLENEKRLKPQAEQGDAKAQFALGLEYKNNDKYDGAIEWLKKAADQGIADAKAELDYCKNKVAEQIKKFEADINEHGFLNYLCITNCCTALHAKGYDIRYISCYLWDKLTKSYCASISVYDALKKHCGGIRFSTHTLESLGILLSHLNSFNERKGLPGEHMILLDKPGIEITSNTPASEPPPEWMMICAEKLVDSFPNGIDYPSWVMEIPSAKKYINVAFQKLGKL